MLTDTMSVKLKERYDNAVTAYEELVTGKAVRVVVDQNGERVEYTPANAQRLLAFIASLAAALGVDPLSGKAARRSRPMRVWF